MNIKHLLAAVAALAVAGGALAAGADLGKTAKQATNWTAIAMFGIFVAGTLYITKWAAGKTKTAADFYTAGGGITGFQNGLAIAGDYMSAASFLGISGLVFANGFDGLIFSIGWLVGWPVITFLMAERLRNLGKFTFADVASYRFAQTPVRIFAATSTLVVVAFYMIAQMVGAGQLIKVLFGLEYMYAEILVGTIMMMYVLFGGMTATTWVQIIKAGMLLFGATFMAGAVLMQFGFSPEALFTKAVEVHTKHDAIMAPGALIKDPISAISVGMALMFGTAGLPHILMRFFTVPNAKESEVGCLGDHLDRLLLHPDLHHRFRRHYQPDPESGRLLRRWRNRQGPEGRRQHGCYPPVARQSAATCSSASSRPWPSRRSWPWLPV